MAEVEPPETRRGHEPSDVHGGKIVLIGIGVVLTIFLAIGGLLLFRYLQTSELPPQYETPDRRDIVTKVPPAPRLQVNPLADIHAVRQEQQTLLHGGYHWVNKSAGIVRMPIDRAIQVLAQSQAGHDQGRK